MSCSGSNLTGVASRTCWQAGETFINIIYVGLLIDLLVTIYQVFNRLQKLGLCLSPYATLKLLDSLGDGHDEKLFEWRDSLVRRIEVLMMDQVRVNYFNSCVLIKSLLTCICFLIYRQ